MTPDEIQRHLDVGRGRAVCVDISLLPKYPLVVRSVVIRRAAVVDVSFDLHGFEVGGLYYRGQFSTFEEAVATLETYLGFPIEQWENFTASGGYPEEPEELPIPETWDRLVSDFGTSSELLPASGDFKRIHG